MQNTSDNCNIFLGEKNLEQECIPVGCIPTAAVAISYGGGGVSATPKQKPPQVSTPSPRQTPPWAETPYTTSPPPLYHTLWTEWHKPVKTLPSPQTSLSDAFILSFLFGVIDDLRGDWLLKQVDPNLIGMTWIQLSSDVS